MTQLPLRHPGQPQPATEAAAGWVLLHEEGKLSEADAAKFAAWLADDEAHPAAYEDALWALAPVVHVSSISRTASPSSERRGRNLSRSNCRGSTSSSERSSSRS